MDALLQVLRSVAPEGLAASWDNVGLLVSGRREVRRVFFTIDLTESVLQEALQAKADAIVAYHPPIFSGLKRLTTATPQGRMLLTLIAEGIGLYSPHTALDSAAEGMGAWLIQAAGEVLEVQPLEPSMDDPTVGMGRRARLAQETGLTEVVSSVKAHLGLGHVRVAAPKEVLDGSRALSTLAVCPGAGGSLFSSLWDVDLLITGEMRHHDVLAKVAAGITVILTDHTNTERGFLPHYAAKIAEGAGVEVVVSQRDADPLQVY